jgi:universal bacterial protein YeaZ
MNILAFDTSSKALSVALVAKEEILGQITLNIKKNHSLTLMPAIDFLLKSADISPKDLDLIAVAKGPGSYTGLRIAVTTAKTLAYSLQKDLVGISSLQAIASQIDSDKLIIPLIDARRKNVYAGIYENGREKFADRHIAFKDLVAYIKKEISETGEGVLFTGEVDNFTRDLEEELPEAAYVKDSLKRLPSAYEIAKLAKNKAVEDVHTFNPEYLKRVEAEEKWLETHEEENTGYISKI